MSTPQEIAQALRSLNQRRSKYGVRMDAQGKAERTVDRILFASKKEAMRYRELTLLEKAGQIRHLTLQPRYELHAENDPGRLGVYCGDFLYQERDGTEWHTILEECKGYKTPLYRWKKRHVEAEYRITIRET